MSASSWSPTEGLGAKREELLQLVVNALGRNGSNQRRSRAHGFDRGRRRLVAEARGELRGAQHAQRVLVEGDRGEDVDPPRADIGLAAVGVDQFAAGQRPSDHVHPEIAPRQVVLERNIRSALDLEIAVTMPGRALAARQSQINGQAVGRQLGHCKGRSNQIDPPQRLQARGQFAQRQAGDDVIEILGRNVDALELGAKLVAHAATNGKKPAGRERLSQPAVEWMRLVHRLLSYQWQQIGKFHGKLPRETTSSSK